MVMLALTAGITASSVLAVQWRQAAKRADDNADKASANAVKALEQANRADGHAADAKRREKEAVVRKEEAERAWKRAEGLVYAGKLALAQSAWREQNARLAYRYLEDCQENRHTWEHRHLWTLFSSNQQTLEGHTDTVFSVAVSPDGSRIVSGSWDKTVKVWDAETGLEVLSLKGHTGSVSCVAVSPDGTRIVSGSEVWGEPGELKVWEASKGQEFLCLKGHTDNVSSVAVSPDGTRIFSLDSGGHRLAWDALTGQPAPPATTNCRPSRRKCATPPPTSSSASKATASSWNPFTSRRHTGATSATANSSTSTSPRRSKPLTAGSSSLPRSTTSVYTTSCHSTVRS